MQRSATLWPGAILREGVCVLRRSAPPDLPASLPELIEGLVYS
jgi:hypothetical protein